MKLTLRPWRLVALVLLLGLVAGCSDDEAGPGPLPSATASATRSATPSQTPAPATSTPSITSTPTSTSTPSSTATRTPPDAFSGGATTVFNVSRNAFAQPAANMSDDRNGDFFVGNALFNRNWVTAPSSTVGSDGLGPLFNARSCSACHFKDGRGRPPVDADDSEPSLLFRLSLPTLGSSNDAGTHGGPVPEPNYGDQLSPQAILHVPPEGSVVITYGEETVTFPDGAQVSLRHPHYEITDLAFGELAPDVLVSPRVAPFLIGLGLLAAVDESTILAAADADDADGDGISGRPNWVWDRRAQALALGRFGWKANQPSLEQQNAGAFLGDMGLTTELFAEENCTPVQQECRDAPNGGTPEIDSMKLDFVTLYTHALAVPARRELTDPDVLHGEELFDQVGCAACHVTTLQTGTLPGHPEVSEQKIHPYSDLLLHDMGPDLADDRPDFAADGREWRTAPLWGVGLVETVNRHTNFMHDGRARNLVETILWHGGEAETSRESFRDLPPADREALVHFLSSL